MSADNGVYIAEFPDGFRVAHAQAIENCFDSPDFPDSLTDAYRGMIFGSSKVFASEFDAYTEAYIIYKSIMNAEYGGVVEYGIASLGKFDRPLMWQERAKRVIDEYWESANA